MRVKIKMNRFGHLIVTDPKTGKDIYLQLDSDIKALLMELSRSKRKDILNGWDVTANIDSTWADSAW